MVQNAAYLVDFDGTITGCDITTELGFHFGGEKFLEIENAYHRREIAIRQWLQSISKLLPLDREQVLSKALAWAELRPGFERFLQFARDKDSPVIIASDGFGLYIEPILERHGLLHYISAIYRNETYLGNGKPVEVRTPHAHPTCRICGNCKATHVVKLKSEGRPIIYIGDGSNDRFGASWADCICARDNLADACRENSFPYTQWQDFYDILQVNDPELSDRSLSSLCCPLGSGVKI
ncbi:MAG TPA: MtnX-like HAD-IB family phosphatase [Candidatus Limnocylindrales bacterium]|nr:MtnX-like HAD-IB family phosphatase [Candidatus Limnocylindrales bacterium]